VHSARSAPTVRTRGPGYPSYAYLGQTRDDGEMASARAAWVVVNKPGARP
jgi:hypothetical protein